MNFIEPAPWFVRQPTDTTVGLDVGVTSTAATSEGMHLQMPKLSGRPGEAGMLQSKLARQNKGSTHKERDWIEKTTTSLICSYHFIATADPKVKNMVRIATAAVENPGKNVVRKRGLKRAISGQDCRYPEDVAAGFAVANAEGYRTHLCTAAQ